MIEGTITDNGAAPVAGSGGLRAIDWAELSARFAAARELRAIFDARRTNASSDFTGFSAIRGTERAEGAPNRENDHAVNSVGLTGRNRPDANIATAAGSGDREQL